MAELERCLRAVLSACSTVPDLGGECRNSPGHCAKSGGRSLRRARGTRHVIDGDILLHGPDVSADALSGNGDGADVPGGIRRSGRPRRDLLREHLCARINRDSLRDRCPGRRRGPPEELPGELDHQRTCDARWIVGAHEPSQFR